MNKMPWCSSLKTDKTYSNPEYYRHWCMCCDWSAALLFPRRNSFAGTIVVAKSTPELRGVLFPLRRTASAAWNRYRWAVFQLVAIESLNPYTKIPHSNWIWSFHCVRLRINPRIYLPICRNCVAQSCCASVHPEWTCAAHRLACTNGHRLRQNVRTISMPIPMWSNGFGSLEKIGKEIDFLKINFSLCCQSNENTFWMNGNLHNCPEMWTIWSNRSMSNVLYLAFEFDCTPSTWSSHLALTPRGMTSVRACMCMFVWVQDGIAIEFLYENKKKTKIKTENDENCRCAKVQAWSKWLASLIHEIFLKFVNLHWFYIFFF